MHGIHAFIKELPSPLCHLPHHVGSEKIVSLEGRSCDKQNALSVQAYLILLCSPLLCIADIAFSSIWRQDPPPAKNYDLLTAQMMLVFFKLSMKYFKIKICTWYYCRLNKLQYRVNRTSTCTGKLTLLWYLLYCAGLKQYLRGLSLFLFPFLGSSLWEPCRTSGGKTHNGVVPDEGWGLLWSFYFSNLSTFFVNYSLDFSVLALVFVELSALV